MRSNFFLAIFISQEFLGDTQRLSQNLEWDSNTFYLDPNGQHSSADI